MTLPEMEGDEVAIPVSVALEVVDTVCVGDEVAVEDCGVDSEEELVTA